MALITRLSRLFTADVHAVLDRVEEPDMMLRQAIREMEESLATAEQGYRKSLAEGERLKYRQVELEQALTRTGEELEVCFESEEHDLARDIIKRRLQIQRLADRLAAQVSSVARSSVAQHRSLQENRSALESMRQKAELVAERQPALHDRSISIDELSWSHGEPGVSDNEVEVAFLREKKRRETS